MRRLPRRRDGTFAPRARGSPRRGTRRNPPRLLLPWEADAQQQRESEMYAYGEGKSRGWEAAREVHQVYPGDPRSVGFRVKARKEVETSLEVTRRISRGPDQAAAWGAYDDGVDEGIKGWVRDWLRHRQQKRGRR